MCKSNFCWDPSALTWSVRMKLKFRIPRWPQARRVFGGGSKYLRRQHASCSFRRYRRHVTFELRSFFRKQRESAQKLLSPLMLTINREGHKSSIDPQCPSVATTESRKTINVYFRLTFYRLCLTLDAWCRFVDGFANNKCVLRMPFRRKLGVGVGGSDQRQPHDIRGVQGSPDATH